MKKHTLKFVSIIVLVIVVGAIGWYQSAQADGSSTPGNIDDPIVTKSYVDQAVAKLVKAELDKITGGKESGSAALEVVTLPWGSKLIVEDGAEIIVRSGKAIAYSSDKNGLSDLTDGLDIAPGKPVANNHLLLAPRGGRGVEADPKQAKGLIVLVRGGYKVE